MIRMFAGIQCRKWKRKKKNWMDLLRNGDLKIR